MSQRDPRREVYEAGLLVLEHGNVNLVSDLMKLSDGGQLDPYCIYRRLCADAGEELPMLEGFRKAGKAYNESLIGEWQRFLTAVIKRDRIVSTHIGTTIGKASSD